MTASERAKTVLLAIAVSTCMTAIAINGQQSGFGGGSSGGGAISPSVVATWEAHFEPAPGQPVTDIFAVPMTLDLLVLWRGKPGWFDETGLSTGSGGSNGGGHRLASRGRSQEVRFDRTAGTVSIHGQTIPLLGANVLLLDHVDDPGALVVAGTLHVEPTISSAHPAQGGPSGDPLSQMIRRSPELFEYLRCDPAFTDPRDPNTTMRLRSCAQLR